MKRLTIFTAIAIATILAIFSPRGGSAPVTTPKTTVAYLVQFGNDGVADVDFSGSVTPASVRLTAWQFDGGDRISAATWKCRTRLQNYWDTPYERLMQPTSQREKVSTKGLLIESAEALNSLRIDTAQGAFDIPVNLAPGDAPLEFLGKKVRVTAVPVATNITPGPDAEDFPSMIEARDGSTWLAYQAYTTDQGDQIYARHLTNGTWSEPEALTSTRGDYYKTAIAQDGAGKIWVVWSAREGTNFDLYARAFDGKAWSERQRLTSAANADMNHVMASDSAGHLYLAYQSSRTGNFDIYLRIYDGKKWSSEIQVSSDPANDWEPAIAVAPDGRVTILWDTYSAGNYDVLSRTWKNGQLGPITPIAATGAYEARVSARYDGEGRLWAAWDQGDWNWGKDYGYDIPESGRGLLTQRKVRVAVLANGRLQETRSPIAESVPGDSRQVFHRPAIVLDGNGNPWVFFRTRVNLPQAKGGNADNVYRAMWRLHATTLRDGKWSPMIDFPQATGRIDLALAVVPLRTGAVAAVWATDGRDWPSGGPHQQDLEYAVLAAGKPAAHADLVPFQPPADNLPVSHTNEARDIERVRAYRATIAGKTFRIARGDVHRHTDLSWDGNRDGSLDDSYRYAIDSAGFDFVGVCDHEAGQSIPYNWSRMQKAVDLYTVPGRFTPLYSYERSVKWPNGHRNVFFSERGKPVLAVPEEETTGEANTGKALYPYLRKYDGVSSPHTSGSGAGTDFRDSDAVIEPVVEIYQGYRSSFETLGAPRSPTRKESTRFTAGFVQSAWARGIKLGVQASSDHVSTHISYGGYYVDRLDRDALIAAMKARRTYAATDNMLVDLRMGDHFMGESFSAPAVLPLSVFVAGTQPIKQVEVIHNNKVVYSSAETKFLWTDKDPQRGTNYYYVRVEQKDGQLCWSSPIWVDYP